jgi:hypothetical protein
MVGFPPKIFGFTVMRLRRSCSSMTDLTCPHDSALAQRRKPMAPERDGQCQPVVGHLEEQPIGQLLYHTHPVVAEDVTVVPELLNDG